MERVFIDLTEDIDNEEFLDDGDIEIVAERPVIRPHLAATHIITDIGYDVLLFDGTYMRITGRGINNQGVEDITGCQLVKPSTNVHCMELGKNELVWEQHYTKDWQEVTTHITRPASDAIRNCQIIFTNQRYSVINYTNDMQGVHDQPEFLFFCRWKRILPHPSMQFRKKDGVSRHQKGSVEFLRAETADVGFRIRNDTSEISNRIANTDNRFKSRGKTELGGSYRLQSGNKFFRQYTFGDSFSGAGGTSEGAYQAGLKLVWAFDFNPAAMSSYRGRFGGTGVQCLLQDCTDFLHLVRLNPERYKVDILHLSPPCKPFSPANTTPNEEMNAINHAVFTVVEDIIRAIEPRVVTMEESDGLEWPKHRPWFVKALSMFIGLEYSVGWGVIHLADYEVPQSRKRLIMIGSWYV